MELVATDHCSVRGRLMATVTQVSTLDYVAKMLGEDPELLEAIVWNDDNLSYGAIISVYTVSAAASPYAARVDVRLNCHGMRSSMPLCG